MDKLSKKINEIIKSKYIVYIEEEFRLVTYPGIRKNYYAIGSYGTVFNLNKDKIMKPFKDTRKDKGYYRINLATIEVGKKKKVSIHRLVAWEFCDGYNEDLGIDIVNHKNARPWDNNSENLEWVTISDNTKHGFNYGHYYDVRRKFSITDVENICLMFESGLTPADVCKRMFGVDNTKHVLNHYNTIYDIYSRRAYANISKNYNF